MMRQAAQRIEFQCPDCATAFPTYSEPTRAPCPNPQCLSYGEFFECVPLEERVRELEARLDQPADLARAISKAIGRHTMMLQGSPGPLPAH